MFTVEKFSGNECVRNVTEQELHELLEKHKLWLGTEGRKGNLADMSNTILRGVDLHDAELSVARLHGADLRTANLHGANLCAANLFSANLCFADLTDTELGFTILNDANLYFSNFLNSKSLTYEQLQNSKNWDKAFFSPQEEEKFRLASKKRFTQEDLLSFKNYNEIISDTPFTELIAYIENRMELDME